jgi:hypothetical protein
VSGQLDAPRADESLRQLIELAVDPDVRPAHGRLICDLLLKQVGSATSRDIRHTLPVLRGHGYLAPALAAREPDDLRYQAETLTNLLSAVFSKSPGGGSYLNVLAASGGQAPTAALLLAVLCLTDESTAAVAASFMAGLARTADLSGDLRDALVTKGFSVGPAEEAPERVSMSAAKRRAGVLRRMLLDPVASPSADPGDGGG